jgi:hypothetical protein
LDFKGRYNQQEDSGINIKCMNAKCRVVVVRWEDKWAEVLSEVEGSFVLDFFVSFFVKKKRKE